MAELTSTEDKKPGQDRPVIGNVFDIECNFFINLQNLCLTFYFAVAAYLTLVYSSELLGTPLGRKLVAVFAAFWLLRLALQQRFFRMVHPASLLISVAFLLTMLAYGIPLVVAGR